MRAYYQARAPEYDDWYLRRGRYSHGVIADAAWNADLDAATQWLDALPISSEIVELAAGTGWWSPLLASKGQLWLYDAVEEPLDRARERLMAHGLAAHIHVRDAWAEPDRQVDVLFCGFWLSHVPRRTSRRVPFHLLEAGSSRAACSRSSIHGAIPIRAPRTIPTPEDDLSTRKLDDGREFTIPKIYYEPEELEAALKRPDSNLRPSRRHPDFFCSDRQWRRRWTTVLPSPSTSGLSSNSELTCCPISLQMTPWTHNWHEYRSDSPFSPRASWITVVPALNDNHQPQRAAG